MQRRGTARVGALFGPIMVCGSRRSASLGVVDIVRSPQVLAALNPLHALRILDGARLSTRFVVLGAVVLAVTGAEALYADMGHFGKAPIRIAWFASCCPALTLNYFGQGALLLARSRRGRESVLPAGSRTGRCIRWSRSPRPRR